MKVSTYTQILTFINIDMCQKKLKRENKTFIHRYIRITHFIRVTMFQFPKVISRKFVFHPEQVRKRDIYYLMLSGCVFIINMYNFDQQFKNENM